VNEEQMQRMVQKVLDLVGGSVDGVKIAAWGLTFKARTDDLRESPALEIIGRLTKQGAIVRAFDPATVPPVEERRAALLTGLEVSSDPYAACEDAEALLVLTEWDEFRWLDFDKVLERLGYLHRGPKGVDLARTQIYTYASAEFRRTKALRFSLAGREKGGTVRQAEQEGLRRKLEADLARVTNERGEPVFTLREAHTQRGEEGELAVVVTLHLVTPKLLLDGKPVPGAVGEISRLSGTHSPTTHGIFFAAGPDIDREAKLDGIHIHDMAPTMLYALGLPVAEDFAGRPWTELFQESFRTAHPLRQIKSWGGREVAGGASRSASDEKLLDDLRSLGYIQ
jgi:hypothetical protein